MSKGQHNIVDQLRVMFWHIILDTIHQVDVLVCHSSALINGRLNEH